MLSSKSLLLSALVLELSSLYGLLSDSTSLLGLLHFVALHGPACALLTAALWPLLPKHYRQPLPWSPLFLFSFTFFIPVFGFIGILLAVFPALYFPLRKAPDVWRQTAIPELPYRATALDMNSMLSMGGLQDVLRHAGSTNKRISAVLETKRMPSRDAIPILKLALKDAADDVRLLAYSMLDTKENEINLKVRTLLDELELTVVTQQPQLHASLAQHYWELVYLGLAQGSVLEHMLMSAQKHVQLAIAGRSNAADWLLAGRVALELHQLDTAMHAFAAAEQMGMDESQLASYRAEVAFNRREFSEISGWLAQLNPDDRARQQLFALAGYWQCP